MSEGKFSQPRPHRDEERQIEESFRQLPIAAIKKYIPLKTISAELSRKSLTRRFLCLQKICVLSREAQSWRKPHR